MTKYRLITLSLLLILTAIGIIVYLNNRGDCMGCDGCTYEPFAEKVKLHAMEMSGDSILQISFVSIDSTSHVGYTFHSSELEMVLSDGFDQNQLRDSTLMFSLGGEKIINGACQPYVLKTLAVYP